MKKQNNRQRPNQKQTRKGKKTKATARKPQAANVAAQAPAPAKPKTNAKPKAKAEKPAGSSVLKKVMTGLAIAGVITIAVYGAHELGLIPEMVLDFVANPLGETPAS